MIKLAINYFVFFSLFVNLTIAQDKLSKENTTVLNQLIINLNLDSNSYLLSFEDHHDDTFLIYKC